LNQLFLVENLGLFLELHPLENLMLALALQLFANSLLRVDLHGDLGHIPLQNLKKGFFLPRNIIVLFRIS
jgi:hypothetical protein